MKKYILLILLFLMSNVSAKAIFDDYRIEVEVNNNHYTVKEKFKVEYNDSYDITYAKIIDNAKYSNVVSNLDEFMIDENDYVTFYLTTGKEYYINYDRVSNDFMVGGIFSHAMDSAIDGIINYKKLSIIITFIDSKLDDYNINVNGKSFNDYIIDGNTLSWEYENTDDDYTNPNYFASFEIINNKNDISNDSQEVVSNNELLNTFLIILDIVIPTLFLIIIIFLNRKSKSGLSKKTFNVIAILTGINYFIINISGPVMNSPIGIFSIFIGLFYLLFFIPLYFTDLRRQNNSAISIIFVKGFLLFHSGVFFCFINNNAFFSKIMVIGMIIFAINLELCSRYYLRLQKGDVVPNKYKNINSYHFKYEKKGNKK